MMRSDDMEKIDQTAHPAGHRCRHTGSDLHILGPRQPVDNFLPGGSERHRLLERARHAAGHLVDGPRSEGSSDLEGGAVGRSSPGSSGLSRNHQAGRLYAGRQGGEDEPRGTAGTGSAACGTTQAQEGDRPPKGSAERRRSAWLGRRPRRRRQPRQTQRRTLRQARPRGRSSERRRAQAVLLLIQQELRPLSGLRARVSLYSRGPHPRVPHLQLNAQRRGLHEEGGEEGKEGGGRVGWEEPVAGPDSFERPSFQLRL